MSAIPPNWVSSNVQAHGAQRRSAEARQSEDTDADSHLQRTEKPADVIEISDADSQVFSDAEGRGSLGRPAEEANESADSSDEADQPSSGGSLDVQA